MNLKTVYTVVAGCALTSTFSVALAQQSVTFSGDGRPSKIFRPVNGLNTSDAQFLRTAAVINMFEIQAAKVAQEHGSSDFTKEYAKEMSDDHKGSLDELKEIADHKGVTLPTELPIAQQRSINFLAKLNGADFDAAYRRAQISGHAMASMKFKTEIDNGRDEDVKAYAVKTLPIVTEHYKMAKAGQTMMGSTKADHGN